MNGNLSLEQREEAWFRLGQLEYARGVYNMAIAAFREALILHPEGEFSQISGYWMVQACLHFTRMKGGKAAYLDTANLHLARLRQRAKPGEYYHVLAYEAQARLALARGDSLLAIASLDSALISATSEQSPILMGLLCEAKQDHQTSKAGACAEGLLKAFPNSPESRRLQKMGFTKSLLSSPATPTIPGDQRFGIQVGAFSNRSRAENLAHRLERNGHPIALVVSEDLAVTRVIVDGFNNRKSAELAGEALTKSEGLSFRVLSNLDYNKGLPGLR